MEVRSGWSEREGGSGAGGSQREGEAEAEAEGEGAGEREGESRGRAEDLARRWFGLWAAGVPISDPRAPSQCSSSAHAVPTQCQAVPVQCPCSARAVPMQCPCHTSSTSSTIDATAPRTSSLVQLPSATPPAPPPPLPPPPLPLPRASGARTIARHSWPVAGLARAAAGSECESGERKSTSIPSVDPGSVEAVAGGPAELVAKACTRAAKTRDWLKTRWALGGSTMGSCANVRS